MKKVLSYINDAVKALIGIPTTIGFIEIINLISSIVVGQYVRLDGGDLRIIIEDYMGYAAWGYALSLMILIMHRIIKDENIDIIKKSELMMISSYLIISTVLSIGNIINNIYLKNTIHLLDIFGAFLTFGLVFAPSLLIVYLWDKKVINKINNKIKENEKKNSETKKESD